MFIGTGSEVRCSMECCIMSDFTGVQCMFGMNIPQDPGPALVLESLR